MADEKTFTQAELDAAIEKAVGPMRAKIDEAMDEAKEAKRKLRAASEIKPEDLSAAEERADRAESKVTELTKQVSTLTKDHENAVKALEAEQGAARNFALEAEINAAIAAGNIVPALVPAFTAFVKQGAKADLVDGKYAVMIGDKPAAEHIKALLDSDDGKHFKAAPVNGGGGAQGGGGQGGGKAWKDMNLTEQSALARSDPTAAKGLAAQAGVELSI